MKHQHHNGHRTTAAIEEWLIAHIADVLGMQPAEINPHESFDHYGLSSREAVMLSGDLEEWLGRRLSPTLAYEYPTIHALAQHLTGDTAAPAAGLTIAPGPEARNEPIAIIGMGCRFPGADNPAAFWRMLRDGISTIGEVPPDRWDSDALYDPAPATPGKMMTRWGSFLERVDAFDAAFFGISPRESIHMDPQQRLLLEVAWEALEDSGQAPDRVSGSQTGVFIGISNTDYRMLQHGYLDEINAYTGTGNALSIAANRLSYVFNLHGPSLAVDTACSSSLVAVHLAVQSLRAGESRMALAAGVNLILSPEVNIAFSHARMMAPDGHCKTFDASADGYVRGEGCGVVVLKRLSDAQRDGDTILALIRGSAVNQDGHSNGLTAPNGMAQQAVIRTALQDAGVAPAQIGYIEAHGTGTNLGDPIEVRALGEVLGQRADDQRCVIGSVKTNIGHLESAAGIAGLIKVVLAMRHGEIPPHLHLTEVNPHIPLDQLPLSIPTELRPWRAESRRRCASVSAFGFGGTNAHVILEEGIAQPPAHNERERPRQIFTLSARDEAALTALAGRFAQHLADHPAQIPAYAGIADISFTANTGRAHFAHRLAITAATPAELREQLAAFAATQSVDGLFHGRVQHGRQPKIAFLFTGQGAQYPGMGRRLYATQPTFRAAIDRCAALLQPHLEQPLQAVLFAEDGEDTRLHETAYTQPALFALEYALAQMWQSWGITPDVVMGHSVGEYVAACIAGVFSLEDGLALVATRGRLMQSLPQDGEMAVIFATPERGAAVLQSHAEHVAIAGVNGPENVVISGRREIVRALVERFESKDIATRLLTVSHAFHSPLVEPMLDSFAQHAQQITFAAPQVPFVSNLRGRLLQPGEIPDAAYWREHTRAAVLFADGMRELAAQGCDVFLEVGPNATLLGMGKKCVPQRQHTWLASLKPGQDDWQIILESLARLYTSGYPVDWFGFDRDYQRRRVQLPTYAFQRERFWFTPAQPNRRSFAGSSQRPGQPALHPLLGQRLPSPLQTIQFETQINAQKLSYLNDHRVQQSVIFPAAAYLEMALAAGWAAFGEHPQEVSDVSFHQALFLGENEAPTLQVALTPTGPGSTTFQIFSLASGEAQAAQWVLHSSGTLRHGQAEQPTAAPVKDTLAGIRACCPEELPGEHYYEMLREVGLEYGPRFRGLAHLWRGQGEALARLGFAPHAEPQGDGYTLHPTLLDTCFQLLKAAIAGADTPVAADDVYLPVGLDTLRVYGRPAANLWAHATLRSDVHRNADQIRGDILLLDETGRVIVEAPGLRLQRVGATASPAEQARSNDWLYEIQWQPAERPQPPAAHQPGTWLLFADSHGVARALRSRLEAHGQTVILITSGDTYAQHETTHYQIDPVSPADFQRLLYAVTRAYQTPLRGIIHMGSLDAAAPDALPTAELARAQRLGVGSVLHLVQAVVHAELGETPRLWLVTRGAQAVADGSEPVAVAQAPVWGLGNVIAREHSELRCARIDLDPAGPETDPDDLFAELWTQDGEDQVAFRRQTRYVPRLVRAASDTIALPDTVGGESLLALPDSQAYRLGISRPGTLDGLELQPSPRRYPAPNEVEIAVSAAGLNFRDVLSALDLYPGGPIPLGSECAGTITALGEDVAGFNIGDEVIALAPHSFGHYATTAAHLVVPRPDQLSFAEAATIPITFLTAYYALHHLGRIQPGERVLIHAAAGGVGLAAVQIAQMYGAEVFATAGSPEKRAFLQSLGVPHVMNSRTLDFADEIMHITHGQGVDLVLNSLAGEAIAKSLAVLGAYGRFLEIGRTAIYQNNQIGLYPFHNNLSYFAIDMDRVSRERPALINALFHELIEHFAEGKLRPLPMRVFPIQEVVSAFRYMAQRKNIGKIVVALQPNDTGPADSATAAPAVRADGTYMITGGLGALGRLVAQSLVAQGARHLVLLGRRGASGEADTQLETLRSAGATVVLAQADVADETRLAAVLADIAHTMPPLRGVIHAAGVLDDGALIQLDHTRLDRVMRPKVQGAWNLHQLTRACDLDFFVLFSSAAGVFGSPGQGNYAAANAFLDALAHQRRRMGLPALAINWGPWAEAGMAARSSGSERLQFKGIEPIQPEQGLALLAQLPTRDVPQMIVAPTNWSHLLQFYPEHGIPPLLAHFAHERGHPAAEVERSTESGITREELLAAEPAQRQDLLEQYLRNQIARVLGIAPSRLDPAQPLNTLGLDSIMAIELKHGVESHLGLSLPVASLLQGPTTAQLAAQLAPQLADITPDARVSPITAGPADGISEHPLSYGQKALWFLQQLAPESAAYHIVRASRIRDELDVPAMRRALQRVVDRHPALRTTFVAPHGDPVQQIHAQIEIFFQVEDAAAWSEADLQARLVAEAHRPFDLEHGPLLRVYLFSRAERDHVLLLALHHIITDLWSLALITNELQMLYEAEQTGVPANLEPLPIQYTDYVRWESDMLAGPEGTRLWDYWRRQLAGELPVLSLPADRPRPPVQTYRGAVTSLRLNADLTAKLRALSDRYGVTLYVVMLAIFKVLLQRYSGQDDVIVGTPTAGRNRAELTGLVGYFVNPLVVRSDLSGNPPFTRLLEQVRQTVLSAFEHDAFPLPLLVERLQPVRDPSQSPLFQVMFTFQKTTYLAESEKLLPFALSEDGSATELAGLSLEALALEQQVAQFDLTLQMAEIGDELAAAFEYNTDLFDAATIARMARHFQTLLEGVVAEPDRPIAALPLMDEAERQQLLSGSHTTPRAFPADTCLHEWFAAQAARTPDAIAVTFEDQALTYRELNRRANQLAHYLRQRGVGPETLVALCVERSLEMIIGILGILKAGGAYVPLDPRYPPERLAFMLEDTQAPVVITHGTTDDGSPPAPAGAARGWTTGPRAGGDGPRTTVALDADWPAIAREPDTNPEVTVTPNHLAYVIFTSGSTGRPKGVQVTHANVVRLFTATEDWYHFNERDVWTLFHSYAFDFSVWELWGALLYGGRLVVVPYWVSRAPDAFYRLLGDEQVTVLNQTPSAFRQLMRAEEEAPTQQDLALRLVIFGGEALELQSLKPWFDRHGDRQPQLVNMYGITETTVHVTYRPLTLADLESTPGSVIGGPIPDLQVYVLDQERQPVPIGVPGELYVGGAGVARGYLNRPELTAERFVPNPFAPTEAETRGGEEAGRHGSLPHRHTATPPHRHTPERLYRTGDLARHLPNGDIEYLGRIDHQVKIRGFRIELGEIESVLTQHPAVREAVVLAREQTPGHTHLVAYVVSTTEQRTLMGDNGATDTTTADADQQASLVTDLRSALKARLPDYMVPSAFVPLDSIPLTPNGKVDRRALPAPDSDRPDLASAYVAPRDPVEHMLAELWSQVLGIERVGIHDNFFDLGGHSLLATQLASRIRASFGVDLPLRNLFERPTVADLAVAIAQYQAEQTDSAEVEDMLTELEQLSADEIRALLAEDRSIE